MYHFNKVRHVSQFISLIEEEKHKLHLIVTNTIVVTIVVCDNLTTFTKVLLNVSIFFFFFISSDNEWIHCSPFWNECLHRTCQRPRNLYFLRKINFTANCSSDSMRCLNQYESVSRKVVTVNVNYTLLDDNKTCEHHNTRGSNLFCF